MEPGYGWLTKSFLILLHACIAKVGLLILHSAALVVVYGYDYDVYDII